MTLGVGQIGGLIVGGAPATPTRAVVAALCRLLGDSVSTPVYRVRGAKDALPCITYRLESIEREKSLEGVTQYATASIEFTVHALRYDDLDAISAEVRSAIDGERGWAFGRELMSCLVSDEADDVERPADGSSRVVYQRTISFEVTYLE